MTPHDATHERRLEDVFCTDGRFDEAFAESGLTECAACRHAFEQHVTLLATLTDMGEAERLAFEDSARREARPGRAEEALRAHALATGTTTAPRLPAARPAERRTVPGAWLAAAAALLALVALRVLFFAPAPAPEPPTMLGGEAELTHPNGVVDEFAPFVWDVARPRGGYFLVRVEGVDDETFALESPRLENDRWTPSEPVEWPLEIRWTLEVYRGTGAGDLVSVHSASASRSSR